MPEPSANASLYHQGVYPLPPLSFPRLSRGACIREQGIPIMMEKIRGRKTLMLIGLDSRCRKWDN